MAASLLTDTAERHRALACVALGRACPWATCRPLAVRADPVRLAQVLDNLVGNALRYTPPAATLNSAWGSAGKDVVISVRDDGPGLTPEQAARVFERFYRADPSRSRDAGGSGLGLAITRSLVEAMGGSVSVTSEGPGQGATFTVRLPIN